MTHEYSDLEGYRIATKFFKSPNGTTLLEKGQFARVALYAIKLPLGREERFSAVMAQHLRTDQCEGKAIYPDKQWQLELDSYVDNQTGTRLLCQFSSEFEHILKYKEGIPFTQAIEEIEAAVQRQLAHMSDDALIAAGRTYGKHPEQNLTLSEADIETVHTDCERAYVFNKQPDCVLNLAAFLDLSHQYSNGASAQFAVSYLSNKDQFVQDLTKINAPKHAAHLLHARAMMREAQDYMQRLDERPPPELLKERKIRRALEGKASIWATFGKDGKTLRLSIPTAMFYRSRDLNDYALTEKDRNRLRDFLKNPESSQIWYPHIDDIVALDYKGKTLYKDDEFYVCDQLQTQNSLSLDVLVNNARQRVQPQPITTQIAKEKTK